MKRSSLLLLLISSLFTIITFGQNSIETKKTPTKIQKFDFEFIDDYTWLENTNSEDTKKWLKLQNEFSKNYLSKIQSEKSSLSEIIKYDSLVNRSIPYRRGKYYYSLSRISKDLPPSLFYREQLNKKSSKIVDPYEIYNDKNTFIDRYFPSRTSKYLATSISFGGSDRTEIIFHEMNPNKKLDDIIKDVKFSNIRWNEDKGVFYKRNNNQNAIEKDSTFQLFYHKLGTEQAQDNLIFDTTDSENRFNYYVQNNELMVIEKNENTETLNFYLANIESDDNITLQKTWENHPDIDLYSYNKNYIYYSPKSSNWGEIKRANLKNKSDVITLVGQLYNHLIVDARFYGNYIVVKYKSQGKFYIRVYDDKGKFIRKIDMPYDVNFNFRFYDYKTKDLFVNFSSYTISNLNYKLNLETGNFGVYTSPYYKVKPNLFPYDYFETKNISYKSRDGKDIPITIVHKKGIELNGNNPTLLKGYGGFGVVTYPYYDSGLLYFLEKGGVFAFAEVRGGGDKGVDWYNAGKGSKKINAFNDFIDGAEFLISEKYTNPEKLAITGGSHGGLLVGVAMTKRPDLFKVAIPEVGVFDMAKFGEFTLGRFRYNEYGNPEIEEEFKSLMDYSPYHNIKEDINYPITLIITSENDDRVAPIHSYKFASKLQNRKAQKNPIFLKTYEKSGHTGNSTYNERTERKAEFYDFLLFHLN